MKRKDYFDSIILILTHSPILLGFIFGGFSIYDGNYSLGIKIILVCVAIILIWTFVMVPIGKIVHDKGEENYKKNKERKTEKKRSKK